MRTAVLIGTGLGLVILGMIFRGVSESANAGGAATKKLPEVLSVLSLLAGTFSLIAGVILLILTLTRYGPEEMEFLLFADDTEAALQAAEDSASPNLEQVQQSSVAEGLPDSAPVEIAGAMASSEFRSDDGLITYYANYAIDGDSSTCWQVSGEEEAPVFTLFLKGKNKVSSVSFAIGNQSEGCYSAYNRPRIIRIDFPNGKYAYATLEDTAAPQTVLLPEAVTVDTFTVTLVDCYPGGNNITCITDMAVY